MVKQIKIKGVFGQEFLVEPGVINKEAEQAFLYGQCHALALAIHKKTGWEIAGALDNEKDLFHLFNIKEDQAIDITGIYPLKDYPYSPHLNGDVYYLRRRLKPDDVENYGLEDDWIKGDHQAAKLFVDPLLKRIEF